MQAITAARKSIIVPAIGWRTTRITREPSARGWSIAPDPDPPDHEYPGQCRAAAWTPECVAMQCHGVASSFIDRADEQRMAQLPVKNL